MTPPLKYNYYYFFLKKKGKKESQLIPKMKESR
jgi:hypothetical protein